MPSLTFTLADAGLAHLADRHPRLFFIPQAPSTTVAHLISTDWVEAAINPANGVCTVTVVASDETVPPIRYTVRVTWDAGRHLDVIQNLSIPQGATSLWDALLATGAAHPYAPIVHGYGPPPPPLTGVLYVDRSGLKPRLHVPPNGGIS